MDIFLILIIAVIVLFIVFLVLNLSNKPKSEPKTEQKKDAPVAEPKKEPAVESKPVKSNVELTSRPDFSDMLPQKEENENNKKENKKNIDSRLKVLKASENISAKEVKTSKKEPAKKQTLADELKNLSPEMKTVVFGKVLDKND